MDWVNQNRFRNWLIAVLLVSNLLTVSVFWMQMAGRKDRQPDERGAPASESLYLMKRVLGLDEQQTRRAESILAAGREQTGKYNDRLSELKTGLADELCADTLDTASVGRTSREIGAVQSGVEMIRSRYFHELYTLCTPAQREKLRPIVVEVFGRKPPSEDARDTAPPAAAPEGRTPPDSGGEDRRASGPPRDKGQGPPSADEKLADYSARLHLSRDQVEKVRTVLLHAQRMGEELSLRMQGGRTDTRAERENIRREEDRGVMEILNNEQKKEFESMASRRRE